MKIKRLFLSILLVLVTFSLVACGNVTVKLTGEATVKEGETIKLTPEASDAKATLSWATSDASVATVDNGTVTGVKAGKATITVTATVGKKSASASLEITVTAKGQGQTYTPGITDATPQIELKVGDKLEPLKGITAIDATGADRIANVTVSHLIPLDDEGCVKQSGEYQIKYTLEIDGEKYNLYRKVTVIFELPQTDDLIVNGDFELGATDPFTKSEFDNGGATLSVVTEGENHLLKVDVTAVSWQLVSPRVETNKFALEAGKYYALTFKAKADVARDIQIQVGQLLAEAPWFYGLGEKTISLTTELQSFELVFLADNTIASDLTQIQALFGFGTMAAEGASSATACYLDDIKVEETKPASLLNVESLKPELGGEADAAAAPGVAHVWYDQGAWCGTATESTFTFENGVLKITGTQPEGSCWFATQLFLYAESIEAGNYTLSFNLKLNKAGKIKFGVDSAQNVAIQSVASTDVVEGINKLTLTFNALQATPAGLSLQFGTEADGNIGAFEAEISDILLVRNGDAVVVDYADPAHPLGDIAGVANDGENAAKENVHKYYVWYVADANWGCGPVTTATFAFENGALTVNSNLTADHWWFATQIFYATKVFEATGTHTVSFKLNASAAGTITINGKKVDLIAGDNNISFEAEVKAGAQFVLSIQLGWEEVVEGADNISHQYIGNNTLVLSDFAMDGIKAGNQGPEEKKDVDLLANPTLTVNAHEVSQPLVVSKSVDDAWGWVGITSSADFTGYTKMVATILGPEGGAFLFKVNDQGAGEKWVTTTGAAQVIELTLPESFAWDATKKSMILFPDVNVSATGKPFVISKLEIQGEGKEAIDLLKGELAKTDSCAYSHALVIAKPTSVTNEWDSVWIKVANDLSGYKGIFYSVQGTAGEQILFKPNDNGALEQRVTFNGQVQNGILDISGATIDPSKLAMVLFANPGAAGSGNPIVIYELKYLVEIPEAKEVVGVEVAGDVSATLTLNAETGLYEGEFTLNRQWQNIKFVTVMDNYSKQALTYANTTFTGTGIMGAKVDGSTDNEKLFADQDSQVEAGQFFYSLTTETKYLVKYDLANNTMTVDVYVAPVVPKANVDLLADLPQSDADYVSANWTVEKYTSSWEVQTSVQMRSRAKGDIRVANMANGYGMTMRYTYGTGESLGLANRLSYRVANDFSGAEDIKVKLIIVDAQGNNHYLLGAASGSENEWVTIPANQSLTPEAILKFDAMEVKAIVFVTKSAKNGNAYLYVGDLHLTYEPQLTGVKVAGAAQADFALNAETGCYEGTFKLNTLWQSVHFVAVYEGEEITLKYANTTFAGNGVLSAPAGAPWTGVLYSEGDDATAGNFFYSISDETNYVASYNPATGTMTINIPE